MLFIVACDPTLSPENEQLILKITRTFFFLVFLGRHSRHM